MGLLFFIRTDIRHTTEVLTTKMYLANRIPSYGKKLHINMGLWRMEHGISILYLMKAMELFKSWAGTYQFRIGRNSVEIESQTHPDSSEWYSGQTIVFRCFCIAGISKYHYEFNKNPLTIPEVGVSTCCQLIPGLSLLLDKMIFCI